MIAAYPSPIILNSLDAEAALVILRRIAEQPGPGEPGFIRHYGTDAWRFIRDVRRALTMLEQEFNQPRKD